MSGVNKKKQSKRLSMSHRIKKDWQAFKIMFQSLLVKLVKLKHKRLISQCAVAFVIVGIIALKILTLQFHADTTTVLVNGSFPNRFMITSIAVKAPKFSLPRRVEIPTAVNKCFKSVITIAM